MHATHHNRQAPWPYYCMRGLFVQLCRLLADHSGEVVKLSSGQTGVAVQTVFAIVDPWHAECAGFVWKMRDN